MNVLGKIKKLQEVRGWTTYKLAMESGITQSTLSNMFQRKTCPTIETLEKICAAFDMSLADFLSDNQQKVSLTKDEATLINKYKLLKQNEKKSIQIVIDTLLNK